MLLTLSAPKRRHGQKVENRITNNYVQLAGIAPEEYYVQVSPEIFFLNGDNNGNLKDLIFNQRRNRQSFNVKQSDNNSSLMASCQYNGSIFEPIGIKIWTPSSERVLSVALRELEENLFFRRLDLGSMKQDKHSPISRDVTNFIHRYNIHAEKRRNQIDESRSREKELERIEDQYRFAFAS